MTIPSDRISRMVEEINATVASGQRALLIVQHQQFHVRLAIQHGLYQGELLTVWAENKLLNGGLTLHDLSMGTMPEGMPHYTKVFIDPRCIERTYSKLLEHLHRYDIARNPTDSI